MGRQNAEQERARIQAVVKAITTHGMSKTRIYGIWERMRRRCVDPRDRRFKDYGGRGIDFDSRWKNFENFYADMCVGYQDSLSLDRIDNNKGYSKENCRWATRVQQQRNRRTNVVITFNGKTQTAIEWSTELGINPSTIYKRINRSGWEPTKALTMPKRRNYLA